MQRANVTGSLRFNTMTAMHKHNQFNEVVQYKTVCSWSLLLLHNTIGSVLWAGEARAGVPSIVLELYVYM